MQLWRQNQHLASSVELYYTELQEAFAQLAGQVQVRLMLTVMLLQTWPSPSQESYTFPMRLGTQPPMSSRPRRQEQHTLPHLARAA